MKISSRHHFFASAAGLLLLLQVPSARSGTILAFGETASGSINATRVGGTTTIRTDLGSAVAVTLTSLDGVTVSLPAFFNLLATSVGPANSFAISGVGTYINETFTGSFKITDDAAGIGTNYLSGTFDGVLSGLMGGASATLLSADPPASVSFTSGPIANLAVPRGLSFSLSGVSSGLKIVGGSIDTFTSQGVGTFSAVPEPSSIITVAIGALGMIACRLCRPKVRGASEA